MPIFGSVFRSFGVGAGGGGGGGSYEEGFDAGQATCPVPIPPDVVFDPLVYNPTAWLDISDEANTTTSGGRVTGATDKTGNGNDFTTPGTTPAVDDINGLQAAYCSIPSEYLLFTPEIAAGQGFELFLAARSDDSTVDRELMTYVFSTVATSVYGVTTNTSPLIAGVNQDYNVWVNGKPVSTQLQARAGIRNNKTFVTNIQITSEDATAREIGVGQTISARMYVGEVLVYPTLTSAQRMEVIQYLANKWGVVQPPAAPAPPPNARANWDFSDPSNYDSNATDDISTVTDKTGNGRVLTSVAGQLPKSGVVINGVPAATFVGTKAMRFASLGLDSSAKFDFYIVLDGVLSDVLTITADSRFGMVAGEGVTDSSRNDNSGLNVVYVDGDTTTNAAASQDALFSLANTGPHAYLIPELQFTGSVGEFVIGDSVGGNIGEILIYPAQSNFERQQVFSYLDTKWFPPPAPGIAQRDTIPVICETCDLTADGLTLVSTNRTEVITIYDYVASQWVARTTLNDTGFSAISQVAISGDGNVLAVSSWTQSPRGSVIIYDRTGSTFTFRTTVLPVGVSDFGRGLALDGDGDTLMVGTDDEIITYKLVSGTYTQTHLFTVPLIIDSLSISSDLTTVVSGSFRFAGTAGSSQGRVTTYDFDGTSITGVRNTLEADDATAGDWFGVALSISRDGQTLAVGAQQYDEEVSSQGKVYIYQLDGSTWVPYDDLLITPLNGVPNASNQFGSAVALDGNATTLAVGAFLRPELYIYEITY